MTADRSNLHDLVETKNGNTLVGLLVERDGSVKLTLADGCTYRAEGDVARSILRQLSPSVAGCFIPGRCYVRRAGKVLGFEPVGEVSS